MKKLSILIALLLSLAFLPTQAQNYFRELALNMPLPSATNAATTLETAEVEQRIWKKAYIRKLIQVSPRVHYGIGNFKSSLVYNVPNLEAELGEIANNLKLKYPWVPWREISIDNGDIQRKRSLEKRGQFFGTIGLNIPLFFIDVEIGSGRFSESLITVSEVWPPQKIFKAKELISLMLKRVSTPESKGSLSLRMGIELERVLPEHLLPKLRFGIVAIGIDAAGYFLVGGDFSYRAGAEVIAPQAVENLEGLFSNIPYIPEKTKKEAAQMIVSRIESSLPTYFWMPAMRGWGVVGKAYINIGQRLRINANYHYESARGLKINSADWLQEGPQILRTFFTLGITTQL